MSNEIQAQAFSNIFGRLPKIQFDKSWKNNTGYLVGAGDASIEQGTGIYGFTDDHGRRGIFIKFQDRVNAVIFERYSFSSEENFKLVANVCARKRTVLNYLLDLEGIESGSYKALCKAVGDDSSKSKFYCETSAVEMWQAIQAAKV